MAKQTLPVDFKDDVLNVSMDGKRRYRLLLQEDGTYVLEDVTDYDTVGSTFGAAQINQTNQAVNQSADKGDVLGTLSQVKSNSDAKKIASANSLKELAVASNLKTYTTLAQLSLSAPVTVEQIFSAMPDNSYVQIDANSSNVVTNMPINSSGLLEISKIAGGRNFARFTESTSTSAANKTMWYGVFSSVAFGGWKKILERDEILATDEEIEANTDPNKIASAVAVKRLNSEFQDWFGVTEDGQRGWKEQGADTVYPFFKTVEITGVASLDKVGGPNDDRVYAIIKAPDGFEISKIIYSSSGFSTNMYYNFNVGGTTIGNQERSNVTNRELDISSAQDRSFLQVFIRQYNESSSGTGSVSYTIQFKRKAG